jgi:hypothetical protein
MTPATIFRDGDLAAQFDREGFVVVPFLDAVEVQRLRRVYHDHHEESDVRKRMIPSYAPGFYASTFNNDARYRQALSDEVTGTCRRALDALFESYRVFYAGILLKLTDPDGRLRVHQDPTLVDEAQYRPVNVWCPLQDIDARNGAMRLLPGSHRLYAGPRATSIPNPWQAHEAEIAERMTAIHMPAGFAILFTQATLHASEPNTSHQPRIVATMFVCHQRAAIQIAHRDDRTPQKIDLYSQDPDFLMRNEQFSVNTTGTPTIGRYLRSLPYDGSPTPPEALAQLGVSPR